MDRKRNAKRRIAIIVGMAMVLAAGTSVYAFEGGSYHDFRDGEISIYLPDGWTSEEIDAAEAGDGVYEQIFEAQDDTGQTGLYFETFFMTDEAATDDYIYFDSDEEGAREYYSDYGMDAINALYAGIHDADDSIASQWEISEPEFFKGQWNGFLVVEISGNAEYDTIYLTAGMTDDSETVVHNMLVFHNAGNTALTEQQVKLAQEIADEFYDYGYGNIMAGVKLDDSLWGSDLDMSYEDGMDTVMNILFGIVGLIAPIIIIAGIVIIIVKRMAKRRNRSSRSAAENAFRNISAKVTDAQQSFDLDGAISKWKERKAKKGSFSGREQRLEKRTERAERREERRVERKSTMQMRTREAESAERRYYESLKTLLKTGLLTKDEMRDMLERHERSRARQRKR